MMKTKPQLRTSYQGIVTTVSRHQAATTLWLGRRAIQRHVNPGYNTRYVVGSMTLDVPRHPTPADKMAWELRDLARTARLQHDQLYTGAARNR